MPLWGSVGVECSPAGCGGVVDVGSCEWILKWRKLFIYICIYIYIYIFFFFFSWLEGAAGVAFLSVSVYMEVQYLLKGSMCVI